MVHVNPLIKTMKSGSKSIVTILFMITACQSDIIDNTSFVQVENVSFSTDVMPIFENSCGGPGCHIGTQSASQVNLTNYRRVNSSIGEGYNRPIIVAGNSARSPLLEKLLNQPEIGERMPLGDRPLSALEVSTIRTWIDEGALDN